MRALLPAAGLDLARDGVRLGAITARVHDDRCTPPPRQRLCDRAADIATCAGALDTHRNARMFRLERLG
ncbi:hypothetical protein [Bradyrhizobium icense]|uniref:hypothetical protein n=1 Tax=Bradyrhizobium icense TaxID=1274631 RepID=UPI001F1F898B|nr:hypothetical protein [Bradyrhizobium icense]